MISKSLIFTALSLCSFCGTNIPVVNSNSTQIVTEQEEENEEECTVMYVGKDVSKDGKALIARSADASPPGMNIHTQIFGHNSLANTIVRGKNGFQWKMPSTTYKYTSTPRNPRVHKGLHWEASAINEKGVGVSAVLTCYSNEETALKADPLIKTGISEDNIAQVLGATATSARQGMEYLAHILDVEGSSEQSSVLTVDKNEAWYMEIYTGHQYAAIKLPDDKVCTIGNEFMLDELAPYGDIESTDTMILSPGLFTIPENSGFAKYVQGHEGQRPYMDLFLTYARPLSDEDERTRITTDYSHRRTWRGINLFAKDRGQGTESYHYVTTTKYSPFFEPKEHLGVEDVIYFMRDRYEDILYTTDPEDPNHEAFWKDYERGELRYISLETAYQIHIIKVHPELPDEIAVEEWLCMSNSSYAPFIPLSNGITRLSEWYSHVSPSYGYDPESAYCIFKNLNMLASGDGEIREKYGKPIENFWIKYEQIIQTQWNQVLNGIKGMEINKTKQILTNFCITKQNEAIEAAKSLTEDLTWHIINDLKSYEPKMTEFRPTVLLERYGKLYGWSFKREENIVTLKNGNDIVEVNLDYYWDIPGQIRKNNSEWQDCTVSLKYNIPSIDSEIAHEYLAEGYELVPIDIEDYVTNFDVATIAVPTTIVGAAAAAGSIFIIRHRRGILKQLQELKKEIL